MPATVRIVIPTRGPSPNLDALLGDLAREIATNPPADLEVLVVDSDTITDLTADLQGRGPVTSRPSPTSEPSAGANRNRGAEGASSDWLLFLDDDVRLQPGWLRGLMVVLNDPVTPDLAGADIRSIRSNNWFSQAAEDFVVRHKLYPQGWYLVSAHLAVRTEAFRRLGGFDPRFSLAGGEDWDLCARAHSLDLSVGPTDRVRCYHQNPTSWPELASRARAYGRSSARLDDPVTQELGFASAKETVGSTEPDKRSLPVRAIRWVGAEYAELRDRGRGRSRAARSVALYVPWMAIYLREGQRAARP